MEVSSARSVSQVVHANPSDIFLCDEICIPHVGQVIIPLSLEAKHKQLFLTFF